MKKIGFNLRLTPEMRREIKKAAKEKGQSMQMFIITTLKTKLKRS